jgi:hypothetical protein
MRYMYKSVFVPPRYDLKFNVKCGRSLYTNRYYTAVVAWTEDGYSILDFGDENDKGIFKRVYQKHNMEELDVDCLLMLNCWDVLYLLENKDCHREEFLEIAGVMDFREEEKTDGESER